MDIVALNKITFSYDKGENIIEDLTLSFEKGKFSGILGESGCGKTTLINLIIDRLKPKTGAIVRNFRKVGVVFQSDSLIGELSSLRNVEYVCGSKGDALNALDLVGLKEYAHQKTKFLSKGMKKRVEIARALSISPDLVIMDEPFGNLDFLTKINLVSSLKHFINSINSSFIYITHDIDEALVICNTLTIFSNKPLNNSYTTFTDINEQNKHYIKQEIKRLLTKFKGLKHGPA